MNHTAVHYVHKQIPWYVACFQKVFLSKRIRQVLRYVYWCLNIVSALYALVGLGVLANLYVNQIIALNTSTTVLLIIAWFVCSYIAGNAFINRASEECMDHVLSTLIVIALSHITNSIVIVLCELLLIPRIL